MCVCVCVCVLLLGGGGGGGGGGGENKEASFVEERCAVLLYAARAVLTAAVLTVHTNCNWARHLLVTLWLALTIAGTDYLWY